MENRPHMVSQDVTHKKERDNIRQDELIAFRKLAEEMLAYDDAALAAAMKNGTITEITDHG